MKSLQLLFLSIFCFVFCFGNAQTPDVWDGTTDTTWHNTSDTLFQLTTAEQLAGLAVLVNNGNNFNGKTIELMNDLDLGGKLETPLNWVPIGYYYSIYDSVYTEYLISFAGVFEGNNKTISNLFFDNIDTLSLGVFGCMDSATIKNLFVDNVTYSIFKGSNIGCIVGFCKHSSIFNCKVTSDIDFNLNKNNFGGIAGSVDSSTITNCSFVGNIQGDSLYCIGGIVGYSNISSINNCYVIGEFSGLQLMGGLVGNSYESIISNSFFNGIINNVAKGHAGGLIGECTIGIVHNCFAISSIHSTLDTLMSEDGQFVLNQQYGGLIGGFWGGASLYNSYITGGFISGGYGVGGIVGISNGYINNSYSAVYTEGAIAVGGIVGLDYGFRMNQSYSDILLSTYNPIGYNINHNKEPDQLFTDEMTSGQSFGLLDNTGENSSHWIYTEGLYPQLDVFVNNEDTLIQQASLLSVIPIFLGGQAANQVRSNFTVSTLHSVSWSSSAEDIINIEGENAVVTPINQDTMVVLTVSLHNLKKEFYLKVLKGSSIKETINNNLSLYPNPANNQLTLDNGQSNINEVCIYDVSGREVKRFIINRNKTILDISDLQNGMYIVKINSEQGVVTRKVQVVRSSN